MEKTLTPGMNPGQMESDRKKGWHTTPNMLTEGEHHDLFDGGGPEVGNPYDIDPMGEEYHDVTFVGGKSSTPSGGQHDK